MELIFASAGEQAQAIRDKQISSEELVRACIKRIEEVNPKLHAVVQLPAESALEQAREADKALAKGEIRGPLHGVPFTLKDAIETEGVISTGGTLGRASYVPKEDAPGSAQALHDSGVIFGHVGGAAQGPPRADHSLGFDGVL